MLLRIPCVILLIFNVKYHVIKLIFVMNYIIKSHILRLLLFYICLCADFVSLEMKDIINILNNFKLNCYIIVFSEL